MKPTALRSQGAARAAALGLAAALGSLLSGCGMCEPNRERPAPADAQPEASSIPFPAPPGASARPTSVLPAPGAAGRASTPACRALAREGEVTLSDGGAPVASLAELRGESWLTLAPNARLVVKEPLTARETTFHGPARVRPCVDSGEETWIESGGFESSIGSGEAPGSEEWVVTPLGVARFGTAKLTLDVREKAVRLQVAEGLAFLWSAPDASTQGGDGGPPPSATEEGWTRVSPGVITLAPRGARGGVEASRTAVTACTGESRTARDLASALLRRSVAAGAGGRDARRGNEGGAPFDGAAAARQVTSRRLARAACAVAAVRVESLPPSPAREELQADLRRAEPMWRLLPAEP